MSKRRRHFAVEQAHTAQVITNGRYRRPGGSTTITFTTDQYPTLAGYLQPQRSVLMRLSTMARIPGCPVSTTRRKPRLAGGHAGRATAGPRVADKALCTKRLV